MKTYLFKPTTTMKEYTREKYWIMSDIIGQVKVTAENISDALTAFAEKAAESGIKISKNALKNKSPMYIGNNQCGYVITGKTEIWDQSANIRGCIQYVDIWTEINELSPVFEI